MAKGNLMSRMCFADPCISASITGVFFRKRAVEPPLSLAQWPMIHFRSNRTFRFTALVHLAPSSERWRIARPEEQIGVPVWQPFTRPPFSGRSWFTAGTPPEALVSGELGEPTPPDGSPGTFSRFTGGELVADSRSSGELGLQRSPAVHRWFTAFVLSARE